MEVMIKWMQSSRRAAGSVERLPLFLIQPPDSATDEKLHVESAAKIEHLLFCCSLFFFKRTGKTEKAQRGFLIVAWCLIMSGSLSFSLMTCCTGGGGRGEGAGAAPITFKVSVPSDCHCDPFSCRPLVTLFMCTLIFQSLPLFWKRQYSRLSCFPCWIKNKCLAMRVYSD